MTAATAPETTPDATVEVSPDPTETLEPISPPEDTPEPSDTPRGPLDPIEKPLWRLRRPDRTAITMPFVGHEILLERWYGRVASHGDVTYKGTLLAIATTTTGTTSDMLIIKTVEGNVWAVSTAQVARVALAGPPPAPKRRGGRPRKNAEATA